MAKEVTQKSIRTKTVSSMKSLGVYKKEYDMIIDIYVGLVYQYHTLNAKFEEGAYEFEVETMQGGSKKAPIVATLETLRKDIVTYSDRLCLNPKAIENVSAVQIGKPKSKLESALAAIE